MQYPPHIIRLQTEAEELKQKIEKLEEFINHHPVFMQLSYDERSLMVKQLEVMGKYLRLLERRLSINLERCNT
jgi:septum formation inhibitor MinC